LRLPILSHGISNFLFSIEFIDSKLNVQEALSFWFRLAFSLVTLSGSSIVSNDVWGDGFLLFGQNLCSAVAWCAKTNLICCAVETCTSDQGFSSEPAFWIPVHVVDPERPTEHSIFNVPAGIYHSQSVQMLLSFLWFQLLFNLCDRTVQWCFSWIFSTCLLQETLNPQWPRVKSIPTTTSKFV
jgi:hypothetical protein